MKNELTDSDLARVGEMLRFAAAYEPERAAPVGLATRVLTLSGRGSGRRAIVGIGLALTAAGAAAAAMLIQAPPTIPGPKVPIVKTQPDTVISAVALPPAEDPRQKPRTRERTPTPPKAKISTAFEKRRIDLGTKRTRLRTVRPSKPHRAVIAKAEVQEEVVHRFESGIIAPVMISVPDKETGEPVLQTSLMKLPIEHGEFITGSEYDSSHIRPVSNEEHR